jgi:flagellar FliL protein
VPEETVEEQEEVTPPQKGGSSIGKMLMVVLLAIVSSAGGGVVSFVLISRTLSAQAKSADNPDKTKEAEQEKIAALLQKSAVLPLEPFVVNLADADSARYLRIKISLMIDDKSKVKEITENQPLQQKVRDVILQSLTAKTSQDLIDEEGKNKLRKELQDKVSLYFREPKLVDVMFTEFVIQL